MRVLLVLCIFILGCSNEKFSVITSIDRDFGFVTSETEVMISGNNIDDQLQAYLNEEELTVRVIGQHSLRLMQREFPVC